MIMKSILILATIATLGLNQLIASAEPRFSEQNVCNKTITVKRDKRVEEPVSYQIPYNTICDLVRTCVQYRTETRLNWRKVTVWEEKVVPTCCPGYAERPDKSCGPVCLEGCRNGKCVAPNECKCELIPTETGPGYTGSTCSRFVCLKENKWGTECKKDCNCSENAFCHAFTGKCICRSNWRGPNCTEVCESNKDPGCDEYTLLQVSDPEANIIPADDNSPRSSALQLDPQTPPSASSGGNPSEVTNSIQFALTQTTMNIILLFITFTLIFSLVRYRQRLERITNELYYTATSISSSDASSGTGSSPIYSEPSNYSEPSSRDTIAAVMQKRPLVPTPLESDSNQLSKNISFATATRNIIKGITSPVDNSNGQQTHITSKTDSLRNKFLLDPLVESRLARSQDKSRQNVYCLPQSQHQDHDDAKARNRLNQYSSLSIDTNEVINMNVNQQEQLDGHYQVPKSPNVRSASIETQTNAICEPSAEVQQLLSHNISNSSSIQQYSTNAQNETICDNDSNIYEEIQPRTPGDFNQK